MEPTRELIDDIDRRRVLRARATPLEEKLRAGAELFDYSCRISMNGIRDQYPEADEAEVRRLLERRLEIGRRLERRR